MNGARTLKIHQDGAAPGLHRPTSTTGGQPLIARCTRGIRGLLPQPTRVQDLSAVNVTSQSLANRVNRNAYGYSLVMLVLFICK